MKEIIILIYINFKESSIKKVIQIDYVLGVNKIKALHKYLIKKKTHKIFKFFFRYLWWSYTEEEDWLPNYHAELLLLIILLSFNPFIIIFVYFNHYDYYIVVIMLKLPQ